MTATRRGALLGGLALAGAPAGGRAETPGPSLDAIARGRGLRFGTAINAGARGGVGDPAYAALAARDCGVVTPENELKWAAVEPQRGELRWDGSDRVVGWARTRGLRVRGHNLLWLNAKWLPAWVGAVDLGPRPALAAERLVTDHITAVCARYGGTLVAWDVVNEAIDPATGRVRDTVLTRALGDRVVDVAFHAARAALPRTPLVYNDYMGWERGGARHRDGVLALLHRLKRDGAPVDALGLQSHLDGAAHARGAVEPDGWRAFLADAAALGLTLSVTELDVSDRGLPAAVGERDAAVGACARAYLDLTLQRPEATEVVCWGLTDPTSWLQTEQPRADGRSQRPCPYDGEGRPKPLRAAIAGALAAAPQR